MASGKKPDPSRRKNNALHASYLAVKNGEKHGAYMAGELFGCYTHRTFAAQPCVSDLTNDEIECPYCKAGQVPEWRGYVPLWDRDWTLRYVLISEELFASVDVIPFHGRVSVSRAKNPISPVVIREEAMLVRDLPQRAPWKDAVAMLPICLTLWKNAALTAWFSNHKPLALGAVEKPAEKPAKAYKGPGKDEPEAVDFDALANRIKAKFVKPSTNGKH